MNYLKGLPLLCDGEESGTCEDFYFEDGTWRLRHLVASDTALVFKKRSLVSPDSIDRVELAANGDAVPLLISKSTLAEAPAFESEVPFSREVELAAFKHYQLEPYWMAGTVGDGLGMGAAYAANEELPNESLPEESGSTLRSLNEVLEYEVRNEKEVLGKACDLILDITDFSIVYLAVDTKPSESGGVRLVSTTQADVGLTIDYASNSFRMKCSRFQLLESPSADLSKGRLSLGDQQKIDLSSY